MQIHAISSCENSKAAITENYTSWANAKSNRMISWNVITAESKSYNTYLDKADGWASRSASEGQGDQCPPLRPSKR